MVNFVIPLTHYTFFPIDIYDDRLRLDVLNLFNYVATELPLCPVLNVKSTFSQCPKWIILVSG